VVQLPKEAKMPKDKPGYLQIECKTQRKSAYVRAAAAAGKMKLADWVLMILDAELLKQGFNEDSKPPTNTPAT
jgi:hypothetical protein